MSKLLVLFVFHIYNDRVKNFIDNCIFEDENIDFIIISNNKDNFDLILDCTGSKSLIGRTFELCKKLRLRSKVINCALVDSEDIKEVEGYFCDINSDLSLTGKISSSEDEDNKRKKTKVKASTLNRILKDNDIENNIDFLSLDTEGYELNILNGLDFNRWARKLICVESYDPKKFF